MEQEIWKQIENYPNYEISNYGRVKSKERITKAKGNEIIHRKERILKQQITIHGYCQIHLTNKNGTKGIFVHRLVANAFLDKIKGKNQVNHKDGNKKNNFYKNLEFCTCKENIKHAEENGLIDLEKRKINMSRLGKKGYGNRKQKIKQYDLNNNFIKEFNSSREASRELGIIETAICNCVKGKSRKAGGYIWKR